MAGDLTKGNIALTISGERTAGFPGLSVTSPSCLSYSRDKVKIAIVIVLKALLFDIITKQPKPGCLILFYTFIHLSKSAAMYTIKMWNTTCTINIASLKATLHEAIFLAIRNAIVNSLSLQPGE